VASSTPRAPPRGASPQDRLHPGRSRPRPARAVGSSITSRRGGREQAARATATSCRWPRDRTRSGTVQAAGHGLRRGAASVTACSRRADFPDHPAAPGGRGRCWPPASRSSQRPVLLPYGLDAGPAYLARPGRHGPPGETAPGRRRRSSTPAMVPIRVDFAPRRSPPRPRRRSRRARRGGWTSRSTGSGAEALGEPADFEQGRAVRRARPTGCSSSPASPVMTYGRPGPGAGLGRVPSAPSRRGRMAPPGRGRRPGQDKPPAAREATVA